MWVHATEYVACLLMLIDFSFNFFLVKSHGSFLCVFFSKVFEEHLVLSLDDNDDAEECLSSLSSKSSLSVNLSP